MSGMHSETRRLCQNNRFPTMQGFTFEESVIPIICEIPLSLINSSKYSVLGIPIILSMKSNCIICDI